MAIELAPRKHPRDRACAGTWMGRRRAPSIAALAGAIILAPHLARGAEPSPDFVYVVLNENQAVARAVILRGTQCPNAVIGDQTVKMQVRAAADSGDNPPFPIMVCEMAIPSDATSGSIAGQALPITSTPLRSIIALGDTGCRMKAKAGAAGHAEEEEEDGGKFQDCKKDWPFPQLSEAAAKLHPDLVIHVGDYLYREAHCDQPGQPCSRGPVGDNWETWKADFFDPAGPLLRAAPWIVARGNHEICARAGAGYARLLDPHLAEPGALPRCQDQLPPYTVAMGGHAFTVMDSSGAPDLNPTQDDVAAYTAQFRQLHPGPGSWLITHRPIWGVITKKDKTTGIRGVTIRNATLQQALAPWKGRLPDGIDLVVSGHIHLWEALNFADGRSPQFVFGSGGTELSHAIKKKMLVDLPIDGTTLTDSRAYDVFGYTLLTPAAKPGQWTAELFDRAGKRQTSCEVKPARAKCGR